MVCANSGVLFISYQSQTSVLNYLQQGGDSMFEKIKIFENPMVCLLGQMKELTGSGGRDNDDGWGYDRCSR